MEEKKVIGGLGFAWCRSGTDWLTPPRGFSRLACEQGSDTAFHQLNRSPSFEAEVLDWLIQLDVCDAHAVSI
ncbi:unnamed protein product [Brassica rapa subsp. trilocularis]